MFESDAQTLKDLDILPAGRGERSVMSLFDVTASYGGRHYLDYLFRTPLSDIQKIRDRVECIKWIESEGVTLKIDPEALDFIEHYFSLTNIPSRFSFIDGIRKKWGAKLRPDNEYYIITRAVKWLVEIIKELHVFACCEESDSFPALFTDIADKVRNVAESDDIAAILDHKGRRFSAYQIEKIDHIFRYKRRDDIRGLLEVIYMIDVFQAVIKAKHKHGFTFAEFRETYAMSIRGLYHPFIENPVANDMIMVDSNITFITGANMAGKSTFMKAFGLSVYLAHMGFPVPARQMVIPVFDGLFTTINVPDDLSLGYSHFYSEVKRVKYVAEKVCKGKKYVVVFDELFRGTNVMDAREATVAVIKAFSKVKDSFFLFSSHIIEAAEELRDKVPAIQFRAFKTEMNSETLTYSYLMQDGVSNDRFGMYIIKKEGIEKLLEDTEHH